MRTVIISDIHIGSKYCRYTSFRRFVEELPEEVELVLNGDILDKRFRVSVDREMLDFIRDKARARRIIWIRGNHDKWIKIEDTDSIIFKAAYELGKTLYISHGHNFERIKLCTKPFAMLFYMWYQTHLLMGGQNVHVAYYAKRFPKLYRIMTQYVAHQAVSFARRHGYAAIACGHTHFAEDIKLDGIRYVNTGAWTECPSFFLDVTENEMRLVKVD